MPRFAWIRAWPLFAALALGGAWVGLGPAGRPWLMAPAYVIVGAGGALGALIRSRRDPARSTAWKWLAFTLGLTATNALILFAQLIRSGATSTHPPLTTLLSWPVVFSALGLSLHGFRSPGRISATFVLDGLTWSLSCLLGLWMWVLHPLLGRQVTPIPVTFGVLATFFLLCASLGLALHSWIQEGMPWGSPIAFITLALGAGVVLLPFWVAMVLSGTFDHGNPLRLLLMSAWGPLALASLRPWPAAAPASRRALLRAFPYLPVAVAFLGFAVHELSPGSAQDPFGLGLLVLVALVVLARQALTLRHVHILNETLEEQVEARTRALSRSQALLMETQQKNLVATLGAGITHDLNNLLGAAMGNLDLLRLKMGPLSESRELEGLEKALDRAGNLSKSLMGLARGGPGPSLAFDLLTHMDELHPLLRAMVPRNIHLTWEHEASPLRIQANPGQVDQVLVNLVSNAKDATPSGGRISLRAREEGSQAVIEVQDTGSGIPDSVMDRLFEPFLTTKPEGKGTGLGLSSVQAVVEHLGGTIEVRTHPQEGTTFTVRLPKAS